ncbi:unnamed protein product [Acanthosepion pharaonis]|uniref:Uncharacterized protein n=1 Tax=Acanthosepion pharaonis TaxID=158019 RepID=A0A812D7E9_ACAPH|nr:unnamed protein product [Sepia pharaonis]
MPGKIESPNRYLGRTNQPTNHMTVLRKEEEANLNLIIPLLFLSFTICLIFFFPLDFHLSSGHHFLYFYFSLFPLLYLFLSPSLYLFSHFFISFFPLLFISFHTSLSLSFPSLYEFFLLLSYIINLAFISPHPLRILFHPIFPAPIVEMYIWL